MKKIKYLLTTLLIVATLLNCSRTFTVSVANLTEYPVEFSLGKAGQTTRTVTVQPGTEVELGKYSRGEYLYYAEIDEDGEIYEAGGSIQLTQKGTFFVMWSEEDGTYAVIWQ